jgi:glucokinase
MKRFVLGIDVGGTNVRMGLLHFGGKIVARRGFTTGAFLKSKDALIAAIIGNAEALLDGYCLKKKELQGIGIGLPGLIDARRGIIHFLPNIPGWTNVRLKNIFERRLGVPTFLENDVNLITLGEWRFGAGRGARNMICMALGTGVGGGLILDNRLYRGEGFAAGEIGHIPLNEKGPLCNCGGFGCLERYVGNRYLLLQARKLFGKSVSLEEMTRLADKGHPKAMKFWLRNAEHIGNGLTGVVNLLNPSRIVIGGGVANAHRHLFKTIQAVIRRRAMRVQGRMVKIVRARLGNDAGIMGTPVLIQDELFQR